jgi:hypothetical protein
MSDNSRGVPTVDLQRMHELRERRRLEAQGATNSDSNTGARSTSSDSPAASTGPPPTSNGSSSQRPQGNVRTLGDDSGSQSGGRGGRDSEPARATDPNSPDSLSQVWPQFKNFFRQTYQLIRSMIGHTAGASRRVDGGPTGDESYQIRIDGNVIPLIPFVIFMVLGFLMFGNSFFGWLLIGAVAYYYYTRVHLRGETPVSLWEKYKKECESSATHEREVWGKREKKRKK